MRPAAETIDPDDCIISRYLRAHKTPPPRVGDGPEGPPRPLTPLEQRAKLKTVSTILGSQGHFLSLLLDFSGFLVLGNLSCETVIDY